MFRVLSLIIATMFALELGVTPLAAQNGNCARCGIAPQDRHCFRGDGTLKPNKAGCEKFYQDSLALSIESDIDFGRLVVIGQGQGSVVIDLATGNRTAWGDIDDLGGIAMAGRAVIQGEPSRVIQIDFPASVVLSDPAGGEAELRDFETDLDSVPMTDEFGRLEFNFTGTLYTGTSASVTGRLRGRVPITVDYD